MSDPLQQRHRIAHSRATSPPASRQTPRPLRLLRPRRTPEGRLCGAVAIGIVVRYQVSPARAQHEGDEGCCLVFDRNIIHLAAIDGDDDQLRRAVPQCIITCVHEELQDADLFDFIPTPIPPADDPDRLPRQDMDLVVYAAGSSHATYLTPGLHDVVDLGDMWAYAEDAGTVLAAALFPFSSR